MAAKARPTVAGVGDEPVLPESEDPGAAKEIGEAGGMPAVDGLTDLRSSVQGAVDDTADGVTVAESVTSAPQDYVPPPPGVYRFDNAYPCAYTTPDRATTFVEPGTEVWWPAGPPDARWVFVADEPAPATSTDTTRE